MPTTQDIVQKLWNLCHVLRDDGITYHQYVTELTYLLFLKMTKETGTENQLPEGLPLGRRHEEGRHRSFSSSTRLLLIAPRLPRLGPRTGRSSRTPRRRFVSRETSPTVVHVHRLPSTGTARSHEGLGDLYEGLLEKNAEETRRAAPASTSRRVPLIDVDGAPRSSRSPASYVQDPAVGHWAASSSTRTATSRSSTDGLHTICPCEGSRSSRRTKAFYGVELVPDVRSGSR